MTDLFSLAPAEEAGHRELTQLNFKIPLAMKRRIKQLAVRDNITLLYMLEEMVKLYEREHENIAK